MSELVQGLYRLQKRDAPRAGMVLAEAFRDDPVWSRVFVEDYQHIKRIGGWFEGAVRYCMKYGEVYAPSQKLEGVVNIIASEFSDLNMWRMLRSGSIKASLRMGLSLSIHAARMRAVFLPLEADRRAHMQGRPYLYIMTLGVDPSEQGKGYGSQLIEAAISLAKEKDQPIYLETETKQNVAMYERHGFKVVKKITLPMINQPMWEMIREN